MAGGPFLAHDGELHASAAEAAAHGAGSEWYVWLPLLVLALVGLVAGVYRLCGKSKAMALNVLLTGMFIIGVASYKWSAVISVLALSGGFGLALFSVLGGISASQQPRDAAKKR